MAVWFNNWNSKLKSNRDIEIAVSHIKEEIRSNSVELANAQKINQQALDAYEEYNSLDGKNSNEIITNPTHIAQLSTRFPDFFRITDTTKLRSGLFLYTGTTHINLEIPELTQIAWETTSNVGLTNKFNYECLYDIESMYNLQHRYQIEINKAADALQKRELVELMNILGFLEQFNLGLESDYKNVLERIDNCR